MEFVFKKRQLKLREDALSQNNSTKPPKTVMNSENDSDTSSLSHDLSKVNQTNSDKADVVIPVSQYKNAPQNSQTKNMTTTIKNGTDAAAQATKIINSPNPPGMIRLVNGVERDKQVVESITFTKKELDKFLASL